MKKNHLIKVSSLLLIAANFTLGQMPKVTVPPPQPQNQPQAQMPVQPADDNTMWYILLFILICGLVGALIWTVKSRKTKEAVVEKNNKNEMKSGNWEDTDLDADKELEWLRKNQKIINKRGQRNEKGKAGAKKLPQASKVLNRKSANNNPEEGVIVTEKDFHDKLEKLQYSQLPISKINRIELSKPFIPLPISSDEALLSAIEQVQDEYEEDEEIRDLALRVLAAFKTRNSVESLAQMALYDLSSNLRSKAVTTLAEFDHESVFEPILLACADPTREVRAAAARGLFRLSFDRADAWTRIAETGDEFKMRQAARAAIEADLVKRSFDRLAHTDMKSAYEAVTLVALLLRAGETREVFDTLKSHQVHNVRKAILQVIKFTKEPNALEGLYSILEKNSLPEDLQKEIDEAIKTIGFVMA